VHDFDDTITQIYLCLCMIPIPKWGKVHMTFSMNGNFPSLNKQSKVTKNKIQIEFFRHETKHTFICMRQDERESYFSINYFYSLQI
jgi:saccharopine dehydrogenase-like NADP-dependent oxidoreductase